MIDRAELKKQLEDEFQGFIREQSDLKKLKYKIQCCGPVIKDWETLIKHSYGIHQILAKWHLEDTLRIKARAEISLEIFTEKYEKFN